MSKECSSSQQSSSDLGRKEEQEQVIVARYLARIKLPEDSRKPVEQQTENRRRTQKESSPIFPYRIMPHHQNYASSSYHYQTYPIPSASPTPNSGLFPFIQSIFRPEMSTLAPRTSFPFLYLSENFLPVSHVRIEEIEENNNQQQWLNKGINITPVHSSHHPRQQQQQQQMQQEKTAINGRSITEATEEEEESDRLRSRSRSAAATLRPNTNSNVSSTGQQLRQHRMSCAISHQMMAPAVQIRSVMPVCSSPPVRRISSSPSSFIQTLEGKRKSEQEQSTEEDISDMSSEFCRVQL